MDDRVLSGSGGGSAGWSEEFNGAAGLPVDPAIWQPEVGGHGWYGGRIGGSEKVDSAVASTPPRG